MFIFFISRTVCFATIIECFLLYLWLLSSAAFDLKLIFIRSFKSNISYIINIFIIFLSFSCYTCALDLSIFTSKPLYFGCVSRSKNLRRICLKRFFIVDFRNDLCENAERCGNIFRLLVYFESFVYIFFFHSFSVFLTYQKGLGFGWLIYFYF